MTIKSNYDQEGFRWSPMLVLSLLLHGVLFSGLFWVPGSSSGSLKMNEVAYEVHLVDIPKSEQARGRAAPAKKTASDDKRQAKRISSSSRQKNVVTVPKRNAKRIKPKTENAQVSSNRLLDNAISKIENKVKTEKGTDYLDRAIARLDKKVGASGSSVQAGSLAINIYKMEVETWIKSKWTYPSDAQEIEAIVLVKIRRDGTVLETRFIKPSRNKIFDEEVLKAIEKAKPLPPLPEGYEKNYEEIKITFNLKDLE